MRGLVAALVTTGSLALCAGPAQGAAVGWYEDIRSGPTVSVTAAEDERVELTLRGSEGSPLNPSVVIVENAAGTLTSPGSMPAPGACDSWDDECSAPCRIESPQRARCSVYDGFTPRPRPLNPYESPHPGFRGGVWLNLGSDDDTITVPADNLVRLKLRSYGSGGRNTWDISRAVAAFESGSDVIRSGVGANVSVRLWGSSEVLAVNGGRDTLDCPYGAMHPQTMRLDSFDEARGCAGDIVPPQVAEPLDPPPDPEEVLGLGSDAVRACIERNVAEPGSCPAQ